MNKLKEKSAFLRQKIAPYSDIVVFMAVLIFAHLFWKYTVSYDEEQISFIQIFWFGVDVSQPFTWMSHHIAKMSYAVLSFFGIEVSLVDGTRLSFENKRGVRILWACTGLKQMYIFVCILLFSKGSWWRKLWFIPFGLFVCHVYNILRVSFLTWLVRDHYTWFDFYHEHVTKYIFYGIIFLLWVLWNEKWYKSGSKT